MDRRGNERENQQENHKNQIFGINSRIERLNDELYEPFAALVYFRSVIATLAEETCSLKDQGQNKMNS